MYDLHVHSIYSDGSGEIDAIVRKAREANLEAIAIVDHSLEHPLGLTEKKARKRHIEIEEASAKYNIRVVEGIECGIKANGEIILPDFEFELILVSIHDPVPMDEYYRRIEMCLRNHDVDVLAHFHSTIFDAYDGRDIVRDKEIIDLLMENDVGLEINTAHHAPPSSVLEDCISRKIKYSIGSDSHSLSRVADVEWGFKMAKRFLKKGRSLL
jgi:putative hydrolase